MTKIVQKEDPILRKTAKAVTMAEFSTAELKKIITAMSKALAKEDDGVAIAAPQIGISKRIFVVAGKVFDSLKGSPVGTEADRVFINPELTALSNDKKAMEEGCLSVRWLYGKVKRATRVTIQFSDESGKGQSKKATGFVAQIFQHEIDHLNGVLFIDHAKAIKEIPPETLKEYGKV